MFVKEIKVKLTKEKIANIIQSEQNAVIVRFDRVGFT